MNDKCEKCGTEYPEGTESGECDWGCGRLTKAEPFSPELEELFDVAGQA